MERGEGVRGVTKGKEMGRGRGDRKRKGRQAGKEKGEVNGMGTEGKQKGREGEVERVLLPSA